MQPTSSSSVILWPRDIEHRYNISAVSRWRWERAKKLPARDVHISGQAVGWYQSTIELAEQAACDSIAAMG